MPITVRVFWWCSLGIVIFWASCDLLFAVQPGAAYEAVIVSLPSELREDSRRVDLFARIVPTIFWGGLIVGFAWHAAYRKQNWARWAYAAIFFVRESLPLVLSALTGQIDFYFVNLMQENWAIPGSYVVPTLSMAGIILVFSRGSREWFSGNLKR